MEFQTNFKILNIKEIKRKNADKLAEGEKSFLKLNLLDNNNNPCSMFVFGKEKIEKIANLNSKGLKTLQDIMIKFNLNYNNNSWNVSYIDMDIR